MHSKFTLTKVVTASTAEIQTIRAAPTLFAEIGSYSLNIVACVTDNPTSCTIPCTLAVDVVSNLQPPYFEPALTN